MIFSDGRVNAVSWATDRPGGFSEADLRLFEEVLPTYSTIVEVKSLRRFATNVLSTYVGREPGELIMKGQLRRSCCSARITRAHISNIDLVLAPHRFFFQLLPEISKKLFSLTWNSFGRAF